MDPLSFLPDTVSFQTVRDFAGSFAIICLLAMAYGGIRARLPGVTLAPQVLGVLFGLVAVSQMHAPIEAVPGIIIDLRLVPVVLAGAFLGGRGLVLCAALAIAARVQIGGVGMVPGVVAIMISGLAGLMWNRLTLGPKPRGVLSLLGLTAMMSPHFLGALLLPKDLAIWYATHAVVPMLALFAVTIPIAGLLLEKERLRMSAEARQRAAALTRPEVTIPSRLNVQTRLAQAIAVGSLDRGASVLRIGIRPGLAHAAFWGEDMGVLVEAALHQRLHALMPEDAVVMGHLGPGQLIVLSPFAGAAGLDEMAAAIQRDVAPRPVIVPGMAPARVTLTTTRVDHQVLPDFDALLAGRDGAADGPIDPAPRRPAPGTGDHRLFEVAERLTAFHRKAGEDLSTHSQS